MSREIVHGLAALACLATSVLALPARSQAIQEYMYEPDKIYTVRTGLGITTQIELSPNEKIIDYSTGFSSGWELNRRENVFYLKPRNVDVDTNMMVRTATHSYIFEDRKSTRLNSSTNAHPVCRLLLEKKNQVTSTPNSLMTKPHQCVLRISHLYLQERTTQNITCRSLQTTTNHIKSTSCLLINSYSIHTTYST